MLFFFQAEDGIRDLYVTGVQTCALPIFEDGAHVTAGEALAKPERRTKGKIDMPSPVSGTVKVEGGGQITIAMRSEEHTSELQSRRDLVCRLLLEKKKKKPLA